MIIEDEYKQVRLIRRDIAPPGGFQVRVATGQRFAGETLSAVAIRAHKHLQANGITVGLERVEEMVDQQTAEDLHTRGIMKWIRVR